MKQLAALAEAAQTLSLLCEKVDEGGALDEGILSIFGQTKDALIASIARPIHFRVTLKDAIKSAKENKALWDKRLEILELCIKEFDREIMLIMKENPNLPYASDAGAFKIIRNGGKQAINLTFQAIPKSISNVIGGEDIETHKIPSRYINIASYYTLNSEAVRDDLEKGKELAWAKLLPRGERLEVRI